MLIWPVPYKVQNFRQFFMNFSEYMNIHERLCFWAKISFLSLFFQISKPHEAVISKTVSVVDAAMVACDKIAYVQSGNLLRGIDNCSGAFR